jgi:hypothetical protein
MPVPNERLEDMRQHFRGDADAAVSHGDCYRMLEHLHLQRYPAALGRLELDVSAYGNLIDIVGESGIV